MYFCRSAGKEPTSVGRHVEVHVRIYTSLSNKLHMEVYTYSTYNFLHSSTIYILPCTTYIKIA